MKYNKFITGVPAVSEIGLGAWQLGVNSGWKGMSEKEAIDMVAYALDSGVNFFDTAPNYGHGSSELRLGKALKGADRDKIVVNTKFGHTDTGTTNYDASYIRTSLEGSLQRLQMDYVDSLIIHNPPMSHLDGRTNDHYAILEDLKAEGKIKAYGASLDTFEEMKLLMETTGAGVIEAFFNIFHQDAARAFPMALEKEVGIIVKIPLDSGWLTGKYTEESTFTDIRERWSKEDIITRGRLVERVRAIIGPGRDMAKTAIAFCLAHEAVSTVIPGNISRDQLRGNLESAEQQLPQTMVEALESFYKEEVEALKLPW
ncbi:aldo/keto reductase [Robertkochia marina]|uniref:Aldo/keto reductase n=1 Tax=Robertkochia marina TaxID=1227945 RepID=A0A4S3M5Y5_9FLAO|nr:aldo/keto reductase [Robertkochia marina]THD69791.1 aldo/keto reductase [Robertkochia marina]TRZ46865.1 aldo/keto reductase [Robertkochia marina]